MREIAFVGWSSVHAVSSSMRTNQGLGNNWVEADLEGDQEHKKSQYCQ
jgi:hypothetical protein